MKLTPQEKALFTLYGYRAVHVGMASITVCRVGPHNADADGKYLQLLREFPVEMWIQSLKLGFVEQAATFSAKLWSQQLSKTMTAELLMAKLIDKSQCRQQTNDGDTCS